LSNSPLQGELFRASQLQFKYKANSPFDFVTGALSISAGRTIAVIGPSGGGKSTLLRLLEGSLSPKEPTIEQRAPTGMIYQDLRLVPEKTALENVLMGSLGRLTWQEFSFPPTFETEAKELLTHLGLEAHLDQPVSMLSGGQKQRVAIARALMSHPHLLLADEPFSHLDHETAMETFSLLKDLQKKLGFSMLITIHSNEISAFNFDEVWQVDNGRLFLTRQKVFPKIEKAFHTKVYLVEKLAFYGILILVALSLWQFPTMGYDSSNAASEQLSFFKKLFFHSSEALAAVNWLYLLERLWLTIRMAFIGTTLGFLISWPLSYLAAEGVSYAWVSYPLRLFLMGIRSVPALVWALFFIAGLGLGPVSGIAALTLYSVGYFTKLLYEGIEDIERKPFHALRQLGASRLQAIWYAIVPSSKTLLISSFVFMLEYNVRSASLLGLVGAGGIGQDLMYSLEWRDFASVFSILCLLIVVVLIFDQTSVLVRRYLRSLRGL
jgi:phosphonate transport system permease protein